MYLDPPFEDSLRPAPDPRPGAHGESAIARQLGCYVRAARGAFSHNTERALRSDLGIYANWCTAQGERALPARAETVAAFVEAMAESRAPATVRRYVTSIAIAQRAIGCAQTTASPLVQLALKRMHRAKGRRQGQAQGLTWPLRKRLVEAAGERLIDARNRALLAVAYDGMLRRAELTSLEVEDLLVETPGYASLLVRRSKTDGEGDGEVVYLARDTVSLVRTWLERSGLTAGRLFRSVHKTGALGERLHPSQVPRIFKSMAQRAGLPEGLVDGLSGHSARVGAAQDMVAAGIEMPLILNAGRWKSTAMVSRYGERLLARRSGVAQLARLQKRE